jgi:solute carrier family 13 (sodium-dependent dicarboxylate transporter), member 2/3/5
VARTSAATPAATGRPRLWWAWLALAGAVAGGAMLYPDGWLDLDQGAARTLGVLLAAIVLWVSRALPLSVTSLLAVGLLIGTGVAPDFPTAAQGFASGTVFFLIAASLVAQAVANAGLIDRIAGFAARASGAEPIRALRLVTLLTGASALVMPSALVRAKAFIPVLNGLGRLLPERGQRLRFLTATGLVLGLLGHVASISVMTGGGMSIVAAGTIAEFHQRLSWLEWFGMMAAPGAALMLLTMLAIGRAFPLSGRFQSPATAPGALTHGEATTDDAGGTGTAGAPGRVLGRERFALIVLALTLAAWIVGGQTALPLAVPAIVAAAVFALPPVGLVTADSLQKQNWDEIMVVGAGLSLGAMLSESGAITFLAERALGLLPPDPSGSVVYLFTVVFAVLIRQLFLQPSPCMVLTLPVVIELGRITGNDPLLLAMLASGVIGATQILPIQSPPALLCVLHGLYTTRHQLRVAPAFLVAVVAVYLTAATLYWPLLVGLGLVR